MNDIEPVEIGERGEELHPAFALIGASRVSVGSVGGGAVLFDSDILHSHTVRVRLMVASRKRDLSHDWIHGEEQIIEVEMSEAQWASFVSSMNAGDGVPCTVRWRDGEWIPGFELDPRLGVTMAETKASAQKAFDGIKDAMEKYQEILADKTAKAADRREALHWLQSQINNAVPNVTYAGDQLVKQAEDVVQKMRSDVEAIVVGKARQLGMDVDELAVPTDTQPALGF